MVRRTKKQKAKIAKVIAIVSAVLLVLIFLLKEILRDNLKDLHDSVAQAEAQFRSESGQAEFSVQLLLAQQQSEILRIQEDQRHNEINADLPALIAQDTAAEQLEWTNLNANFDTVSRLIDKLPSGAKDSQRLREEVRTSIRESSDLAKKTLNIKTTNDADRFVLVKGALIIALAQEIGVVLLGDAALTRAQQVQDATERLIRMCSRAFYVLGFCLLVIGLYSAVTGLKSDVAE